MNKEKSELATVDKCLAKDAPEEQLCSVKNGLVNGLVHPKKGKRNRKNKCVEKQEESVEKDQANSNINHCKNIEKAVDQNILEPLVEKGIENHQSSNFVNIVDNLKSNDEKQKPVDIDSNHKLDETNCDINASENNENSPSSCTIEKSESVCSGKNDIGCVSELLNDIQNLNLDQKCEKNSCDGKKVDFVQYESELQMPMIMKIIQKDLSEPYSIYTYRYFIHNWPKLCFLAMSDDQCVGAIVCKLDVHRKVIRRGYIAMLAVDQNYRKLKIGSTLVQMAIHEMTLGDADEVVLETEVTNKPALKLYEKLGFVRDKRLFRYYLNGVDALRLKLWLR